MDVFVAWSRLPVRPREASRLGCRRFVLELMSGGHFSLGDMKRRPARRPQGIVSISFWCGGHLEVVEAGGCSPVLFA